MIRTGGGTVEHATKEILEYYGSQKDRNSQEMIVQMLREIQEVEGFITPQLKKMAAETAGVNESLIQIIIKRYPSLKEVNYKHTITACSGPRCGAKQAMELLDLLKKELEIQKDGISKDGTIYLKTQNCLKRCKTSPNILVDDVHIPYVTKEKIKEVAERLRNDCM